MTDERVGLRAEGGEGRRLGWVLALTSAAFFMSCLDTLVVATALPRIQESLHVSFANLQWTVNAYNIAVAAGIICAAALGDRFGRRRLFCLGLGLFTLASAACALAPSAAVLIGARTVQGLGGAVILPLSLTILTEAFPAERRATVFWHLRRPRRSCGRPRPDRRGAITQGVGWHWIFWINIPIGWRRCSFRHASSRRRFGPRTPIDLGGVGLCTVAMVGITWGSSARTTPAGEAPRSSPRSAAAPQPSQRSSRGERRVAHPMLSLRLLRIPAFAAGNAAAFSRWDRSRRARS